MQVGPDRVGLRARVHVGGYIVLEGMWVTCRGRIIVDGFLQVDQTHLFMQAGSCCSWRGMLRLGMCCEVLCCLSLLVPCDCHSLSA
jgi:hypothetical protein